MRGDHKNSFKSIQNYTKGKSSTSFVQCGRSCLPQVHWRPRWIVILTDICNFRWLTFLEKAVHNNRQTTRAFHIDMHFHKYISDHLSQFHLEGTPCAAVPLDCEVGNFVLRQRCMNRICWSLVWTWNPLHLSRSMADNSKKEDKFHSFDESQAWE